MTRERIVEVATELIGSPSIKYVPGQPELGRSPETGFDCSGFVGFVLEKAGLFIPDFIGMDNVRRPIRHASEFWDHYGVPAHGGDAGDLILYSRNGLFPTHIGIVRDEESYIHAPGKDGTKVMVSGIDVSLIDTAESDDVLYFHNPIGFKSPVIPVEDPTYRYHQGVI